MYLSAGRAAELDPSVGGHDCLYAVLLSLGGLSSPFSQLCALDGLKTNVQSGSGRYE